MPTVLLEQQLPAPAAAAAAAMLRNLAVAQEAQDKAVRKAAGAALHKLKASGAVVAGIRAPKVAGLSVVMAWARMRTLRSSPCFSAKPAEQTMAAAAPQVGGQAIKRVMVVF